MTEFFTSNTNKWVYGYLHYLIYSDFADAFFFEGQSVDLEAITPHQDIESSLIFW